MNCQSHHASFWFKHVVTNSRKLKINGRMCVCQNHWKPIIWVNSWNGSSRRNVEYAKNETIWNWTVFFFFSYQQKSRRWTQFVARILNYHYLLKQLKEKHKVCIKDQGNSYRKLVLWLQTKHLLCKLSTE